MNTHLGRLEQQILQIVCARGNATVREVLSGKEMHRMAYSTVMTTLDRIYKKGFLDRTKEGAPATRS
jgi:predicted transcriptional regulator